MYRETPNEITYNDRTNENTENSLGSVSESAAIYLSYRGIILTIYSFY